MYFERERESTHTRGREGQRERGKENPKQAPLSAQSPKVGLDPAYWEIMT